MRQQIHTLIPKPYLDELLSKIHLEDVIREHVPELKRAGNKLTACCPFHEEKTPSFNIYDDHYHCYGCGAHGNAIGFVMESTGCNFLDAVTLLSRRAGMTMPKVDEALSPELIEERKRFAANCTALREAQKSYAWWFNKSPHGKEYLLQRGLTMETIEKFGIGYAPERKHVIAESKYIDQGAAELAGLVIVNDKDGSRFDRFRHRIMIPIYKGKRDPDKDYIIGFGGRAVGGQEPKYLNSPETEVFKKGDNLYGLRQALTSKKTPHRVFVVEGYMDAVMLSQYGVENVVASMGTAVTDAQVKKLMRLATRVTFCMDGDAPGIKAAVKIAEALLPHLNDVNTMDFIVLPNEADPDEYVRAHGVDAFLAEAEKAKGASDFIIDNLKEREDTSTSAGMARYLSSVNKCAELIMHAPINLAFKNRAAEIVGISLDVFIKMSEKEEPPPQSAPPAAEGAAPFISVAARLLALAVVRDVSIAPIIDLEFLGRFLTAHDREMLFPLVLNVRMNPTATKEALIASLAYNQHITLIKELVASAQLLGEKFDAQLEAKLVFDGFRKMQRVWKILEESQNSAGN